MKYTAEITNKSIHEGLLTLQLRYVSEDRSVIIQDSISTRSPQDDNWYLDAIKRKCSELEGLDVFLETIPIGIVEIDLPKTKKIVDIGKEQYKQDLSEFNVLVSILSKEIITQDNEHFLKLHKKLKDNFKIEYIDLF